MLYQVPVALVTQSLADGLNYYATTGDLPANAANGATAWVVNSLYAFTSGAWRLKVDANEPNIRGIKSNVTISSNVTLTDQALSLVNTSSSRSLTLPAPSASSYMVLKDIIGSASSNNVTLVRHGSEKIETVAANYILNTDLFSVTIVSNGTDWFLI